MKHILKDMMRQLFIPLLAVAIALIIGGILIALTGKNPFSAYASLFQGAFGSIGAISATIMKSTPLIFSGLTVAIGFRCKLFNIGGEGQLLVGAFAAAIFASYVKLPALIHLPLVIVVAIAAGAAWAFVPAILKVKRGVHEVISTIMMNYVAIYTVNYLVVGPFKAPGEITATQPIADTAKLGWLLMPPNKLSFGILIAILCAVLIYVLLNKTSTGYEIRAVGLNRDAAKSAGINVGSKSLLALLIGGALAGLGGGIEIIGNHHRLYDGFSTGMGFDGIPVALLARNNPFGVIVTALLFGALRNGSITMQAFEGVSKDIVYVIQGIIIVFIAGEYFFRMLLAKRKGAAA